MTHPSQPVRALAEEIAEIAEASGAELDAHDVLSIADALQASPLVADRAPAAAPTGGREARELTLSADEERALRGVLGELERRGYDDVTPAYGSLGGLLQRMSARAARVLSETDTREETTR